MYLEHTYIE